MSKNFNEICWIISFVVGTTLLIWLPHFLALPDFWNLNFSNGFNTIYRNFDGLNYVIIAKTFYDPTLIAQIPQTLPANYFAAHFPGFPILIALFAPIFGYLKSMLLVSLLFTILSSIAFYFLVKNFKLTSNPLLLTLIFTLLPARWIIVRSVGSPEPIFIFFVIISLYFFLHTTHYQLRSHYIWISAVFAALAQLVRPPGVLLALSLGLCVLFLGYQKKSLRFVLQFYPFLLVPLTLLGIFSWFNVTYNDFWAYFHSGDNIHLVFPPFQIFNVNQFWVGTSWLEDVIYIFILGLIGGILLFKQKLLPLGFFVLTYLAAAFFVAHRDISRYTLPIAPFIIIAFEKILVSKEFRIVLIILSIAFYLYSQNFILNNTAPVPNLSYYD
jgi:4-amino-4-deoxy-L-arabinose transferase-like glycosyltransferase